ncbi:unnamed protein product [Adineta steineri]|uniref:protein-tyrosine-phosphatase n=1 Tax=Adineta steineri TaxID=433720 RepID=A0A814MDT1_9BILA|nr:unnamed protein product [Adineta steineri]CAF1077108.1 unnamed protein product [Adineta steineri]
MNQQELISIKQQDYTSPSMIIDDFLYHGDIKHAMNKILLEELGIQHIINASDCKLDQDILDRCHVLWVNVEDDTYSDIAEYFKMTNEFLQSCKANGEKVLVHCQMGVSRSSSIVLAYLIKYHHDSLDKAYNYLVERRHCAEPNLGFLLQLIRYEKELHKKNESIPETSAILINSTNKLVTIKNNVLSEEIPSKYHSQQSQPLYRRLCCLPINTRSSHLSFK